MGNFMKAAAMTALVALPMAVFALQQPARAAEPRVQRSDREYVLEMHRRLLDRVPGPGELDAAEAGLRKVPYRIVEQNRLLDAPEFKQRVDDAAYLAGLYLQVKHRRPLLHEILFGLHALEAGVARSEILGSLVQPDLPVRKITPTLARIYNDFLLDFRPRKLKRFQWEAAALPGPDPAALRARLLEEADQLGGLEPGLPDSREEESPPDDAPRYNVYYGYIHAHTRVSLDALLQGSPGPFEAFDYARNVGKLDYLGLSDHSEFISTWPWKDEWSLLQRAVDASNEDGAFVALRGFEYSNPLYGHLNVFGTSDFTSTWFALTLRRFYEWLALHPEAACTFNHPGAYDFLHLEFMHFRFFPDVRRQLTGIELLTHNDQYSKYDVGYVTEDGLGHLDEANHAGWRVGSVSAQDNHRGGWGTIDNYRTAVLARALTQEDILDALRHRRFYSTQDKNLVMSLRVDGREMGAFVGPGDKNFTVTLDDADGEGFSVIDLYANGALVDSRAVSGKGSWEFVVAAPAARSYYYVLVTQADSDQAMSAPIWVEGAGGDSSSASR